MRPKIAVCNDVILQSDEPLSHVRLWVEMCGKDTMNGIPFTLMTPFPRKIFTDEDMEAPIKALGTFSDINLACL